ncbi:DNA repair protein SWI5 homolog isoform X1 [Pelodiscus sinensis]|uniref:DNA repair protein SWI5 homolog isoform X1 n=1 Tax=Pelodiscus sinensis TaxID=13735 RepID=UPI0003C484AE|nr:DNA repair protein SWI5 homolog [Pelodiscus sinensis]|eukprot:XP_006119078.1 DNA repair protein SWI5 homolog [Pelodiscus sinensis]
MQSGNAAFVDFRSSVPQAALDNHEQGPPVCGERVQSPGLQGRSGPLPRPFLRRTPTGILRNCNARFKSPIQSPRSSQSDGVNKEDLLREIEELKQKDLDLDREIAPFLAEGYSLEELEKHISLLHEYNDIKDTGQMLLGKLAMIRGVTTKELYPQFDLELTD